MSLVCTVDFFPFLPVPFVAVVANAFSSLDPSLSSRPEHKSNRPISCDRNPLPQRFSIVPRESNRIGWNEAWKSSRIRLRCATTLLALRPTIYYPNNGDNHRIVRACNNNKSRVVTRDISIGVEIDKLASQYKNIKPLRDDASRISIERCLYIYKWVEICIYVIIILSEENWPSRIGTNRFRVKISRGWYQPWKDRVYTCKMIQRGNKKYKCI